MSDVKPVNIFAEETLNFVLQHVNPNGLRVLEVGCGSGEFAARFIETGATLVALDTDQDAIEAAHAKGVNAINTSFLSYDDDPFDIIIFTRSLHHIHELKTALAQAKALLKPTGKLILEEFDLANVDHTTTRWYYDILTLLAALIPNSEYAEYVENPLKRWEADHAHEPPLHTGDTMITHLETLFKIIALERNPYLFRSIGDFVGDKQLVYGLAKKVLQIEKGLIDDKSILPCGLRIIAEC
ncbi:class I SAM-dependent methyltransferase [Fulvivirgaceae bacterium BMA12]|uniref:Class I SAM-dependent methyltransferase n=1 Tax=Agaribacillus aureus TaxID=3051825 RepID=A0ABT8L4S2_9BACT|nr:class I SAM-dependent methyltransferase [Fulvivirgaceae bacterium BMA12]